jgi:hypothetical protein
MLDAGAESRERAIALIALLYGALSLSRAVAGTPLSDEFLRAAKKLGERSLADQPKVSRSEHERRRKGWAESMSRRQLR